MPRDRDYDRRDDDRYDVVQDARDKVFPPALALMIAAILGILSGLGLIAFAVAFGLFMGDVAEKVEAQQQAVIAQQKAQQAQQFPVGPPPPPGAMPVAPAPAAPPFNMKQFFALYGAIYGVWGVLLVAKSIVILIGSIKMKSLGSYGWSMTAAILGIASIVSCNLLAVGFGIWALIVLMDADVKEGFSRASGGERPRTRNRGDLE